MFKILKDKLNLRVIPPDDIHLPCLVTLAGLIIGIILISHTPQLQSRFYYKIFEWSIYLSILLFIVQKNKFLLIIFSILLGILITLNWTYNDNLSTNSINQLKEKKLIISGKVSSHPFKKHGFWNYSLKNVNIKSGKHLISTPNKVFHVKLTKKANLYDKLTIKTDGIKEIDFFNTKYYQLTSPILLDVEKEEGILIKITSTLNHIIENALSEVKNHSSHAILKSLLTANRSELSAIQKKLFKESGLFHLLALSGLHIIVIISFIFVTLKPFPIPIKIKNILVICSIWIFYISTGCPPTLFRASTAASLYLMSSIFQRKGNSKNALGAAGILWLLLNPNDLFSPGFQLSFTASFVILETAPILEKQISAIQNKIIKFLFVYLYGPTFMSTVIIIFTAPIILYHFGIISWGGLILNIPGLFFTNLSIYLFLSGTLLKPILIGKILIIFSSTIIQILYNLIKLITYKFNFQIITSPISPSALFMLITVFIIFKFFPKTDWKLKSIIVTFLIITSISSSLLKKESKTYDAYYNKDKSITFINREKINLITTIKNIDAKNNVGNISQLNEWRKRTYTNTINILIIKNLQSVNLLSQYLKNVKVKHIIVINKINTDDRDFLQSLSKDYSFKLFEYKNRELKINNIHSKLIINISNTEIIVSNSTLEKCTYEEFKSLSINKNGGYNLFKTKIKLPTLIRI